MPFCASCKNLVPGNSAFCNHCGAAVDTASTVDFVPPTTPESATQSLATPLQTYQPLSYQTAPVQVDPPKKSKTPLIVGIVIAVLVLAITTRAIYVNHQHRLFYNSLLTRQTEIKQDDFHTVCANLDSCVGRFIVWDGIVDGNPPQGNHSLTVVSANGHAQINLIDPLPMDLHDGDKIIFDGFLGEVNILSPDIVNIGYVRQMVATADQLAHEKKTTEQKEAQDSQLHQADTGIALKCDDPGGSGGDAYYFYYGDTLKEFFTIPSYGGVADRVTLSLRDSNNSTLTFDCTELDRDLSGARECSSYTLNRASFELSANHSYSAAMAEARGSDTSTDSFQCQQMDKGEAAQILAQRSQALQK
jgi:hypothetical protein